MPADDVTFNTIGFTGTMTANSTFTLYRDSEGTGAKSYNVYCKNLSGNYNLILTTGVSGATNFTIKGGSNIVARILVDENGNIVSQSMTATSSVSSGNSQPVTSGGVYDILKHYPDVTYYNSAQSANLNCNDITDRVCLVTATMENWASFNFPFRGLMFIITANNEYGDGFQKAISWGSNDIFPEFTRVCKNGVWQSWKRIPYIDYTSVSGTTDNNGLLDLGSLGNCIPLIVYNNNPYITQFFNGASASYHPYVRIINYDGTPIANTQVTLRLIVLPL
jgi:hypothetical protein